MYLNVFIVGFLSFLCFVNCLYPPVGDEVLPGSVLLPASRRGRYLANIVRRQAVDGTGIKFNKDADRMNAEAKKKVDVLSDELLPYIIAEQERRTTLYKRIMTAIQNGEKGVTIAEIRNKPPLIIRKGLLYRCPANRAPKEPDGSGSLMCEEEIEPTQVMYDSCLSTEDKELYNAENKYFFCNRHRIEGPDLPRNGSSVVGCAPLERTSLNYTLTKCSLEDTNDVVVHYRYYPDRTYKFVMELDPDHEVCDHWNPCQIGYIFSLPGPDSSIMANELYHGYDVGDYERDEYVPQDAIEEFVHPSAKNYQSSPRRVKIPTGYKFQKLYARRTIDNYGWDPMNNNWQSTASVQEDDKYVIIRLAFPESWSDFFYSTYYAGFVKAGRKTNHMKPVKFLTITMSSAQISPVSIEASRVNSQNSSLIPYKCPRCHLQGIMVRTAEGHVHNIDPARYRIKEHSDRRTYLEVDVENLRAYELGDFFAIIQNPEGVEERVKVLSILIIKVKRLTSSLSLGAHFDETVNIECDNDCEPTDVTCNGISAVEAGRVGLVRQSRRVTFTFPAFDDSYACVYVGIIRDEDHVYRKVLAVIDSVKLEPKTTSTPPKGEQFEEIVKFTCEDCTVEKVTVNGLALEAPAATRRAAAASSGTSIGFYVLGPDSITIRITEFTEIWEGVYQAVFNVDGENVTKTILETSSTGVTREALRSASALSGELSDSQPMVPAGSDSESEGHVDPAVASAPAGTKPTNAETVNATTTHAPATVGHSAGERT